MGERVHIQANPVSCTVLYCFTLSCFEVDLHILLPVCQERWSSRVALYFSFERSLWLGDAIVPPQGLVTVSQKRIYIRGPLCHVCLRRLMRFCTLESAVCFFMLGCYTPPPILETVYAVGCNFTFTASQSDRQLDRQTVREWLHIADY